MEIERKFLIKRLPEGLESYPNRHIEQAYLCTDPVIRIRQKGDRFILTCKGSGMMSREEFELPLPEGSYRSLLAKAEGRVISKQRYNIPYGKYTIELDIFEKSLAPIIMAEVEFPSEEEALAFTGPDWFGEDVTNDPAFHNSNMSAADYVISEKVLKK